MQLGKNRMDTCCDLCTEGEVEVSKVGREGAQVRNLTWSWWLWKSFLKGVTSE